jgi:hypothetical protein
MAHYRLMTEWQANAHVDRVWDVLLRQADWPLWWRGFRAAEQLAPGDDRGIGMRIRQRWRSLLPYTLVIDLEITEIERKRRLVGRASGDMSGTCTWTLEDIDDRTRVRFEMDVRPARWWMNLPVPLAGKAFRLNFDTIMRWGSEGMAQALGVGVVAQAPQVGLAGA